MTKMLTQLVAGLPGELAVVILALLPIGELRAAIPIGVLGYHLPVWEVFLLAQVGNLLPVLLIYALGKWWVDLMERRRGWLHRMTDRVLRHTHEKMHQSVAKWGAIALVTFVAIPFPGTGAWTGALGAFILHIPLRKAVPCIALGNLIAGILVTAAVLGGLHLFG